MSIRNFDLGQNEFRITKVKRVALAVGVMAIFDVLRGHLAP